MHINECLVDLWRANRERRAKAEEQRQKPSAARERMMIQSDFNADFSAKDLASDAQRAMYDYWLETRGSAAFPPKSALDPVEFPRQSLSSLTVLEPIGDDDFRIRIVGTRVRAAVGKDNTGQLISQIAGAEEALEHLRACTEAPTALFCSGRAAWAFRHQKFYTSLMLPFGTQRHVERIMMVFHFTHHMPTSLQVQSSGASMQQC
tara:strand:- start:735 stop:1349 length:615 start_codon:yes stop_codon:yes gene_type:complete